MAATGVAIWDYAAATETELSFVTGDVIEIITGDEGGWTLGKIGAAEGWFPSTYLRLNTETQEQTPTTTQEAPTEEVSSPTTQEASVATTTATVEPTAATTPETSSPAASDATPSSPAPLATSTSPLPSAGTTSAANPALNLDKKGSRISMLGLFSKDRKRASVAVIGSSDGTFSILEQKEATRELLEQKLEERPAPADLVSKNILEASSVPKDPLLMQRSQSVSLPASPLAMPSSTPSASAKKAAPEKKSGGRISRWFGFSSGSKKEVAPSKAQSTPVLPSSQPVASTTGTVLGMPLESLLQGKGGVKYEVPLIVKNLISFLEQHGVQEGIFRLSGAVSEVEELKKKFKTPDDNIDVSKVCKDPNSAAVVLKQFFGQLPEPIFTFALFDEFIGFAEKIKGHKQIENIPVPELQSLLKKLPQGHYTTVQYLINYLKELSKFNEKTKMASSNLALVFGPNLLRSKEVTAESLFGMNGSKLAEILIVHYDIIFAQ